MTCPFVGFFVGFFVGLAVGEGMERWEWGVGGAALTSGGGSATLPQAMGKKASWASFVIAISRGILHDRVSRRGFILYVIGALLVMLTLGYWPLSDWLEDTPVRFLFWWGGCGFLAIFLFLLGIYDFLRILRENDPRG